MSTHSLEMTKVLCTSCCLAQQVPITCSCQSCPQKSSEDTYKVPSWTSFFNQEPSPANRRMATGGQYASSAFYPHLPLLSALQIDANGNDPTRCRRDISLVSNAPIDTCFGPQNITVITSQESHHQHAFFDQICTNSFSIFPLNYTVIIP